MDIRMYRTADNPRNLQKYYTRDSSLVPGPFSNVDAAVFGPGSELDIDSLILNFEAKQSGSGDPSPVNVRPITGYDSATVVIRSGSEGNVIYHDFGGNYYKGTYNALTGELYITHNLIQLTGSNITFYPSTGPNNVRHSLARNGNFNARFEMLCNQYKTITTGATQDKAYRMTGTTANPNGTQLIIYDNDRFPDELTAKASLNDNPVDIYYPLRTPYTVNVGEMSGLNLYPGNNRLYVTDEILINELTFTLKSSSAAIEKTNGFEVPDAAFISENDRRNPVLRVLSGTDLTEYNYVYISEYDRFYFCEVTNLANGVYLIHCHLDLLMSCKDKIKALNCTVERSASDGSSYLADDQYPVNSYKKYITRLFPHGVDGNSYILMTVGNKIIEE